VKTSLIKLGFHEFKVVYFIVFTSYDSHLFIYIIGLYLFLVVLEV